MLAGAKAVWLQGAPDPWTKRLVSTSELDGMRHENFS